MEHQKCHPKNTTQGHNAQRLYLTIFTSTMYARQKLDITAFPTKADSAHTVNLCLLVWPKFFQVCRPVPQNTYNRPQSLYAE